MHLIKSTNMFHKTLYTEKNQKKFAMFVLMRPAGIVVAIMRIVPSHLPILNQKMVMLQLIG